MQPTLEAKIEERGSQATVNRKAATFWHPNMLIHAISNETMCMKLVHVAFLDTTRLKSCKSATSTKIVQTDDHVAFKNA